MVNIVKYLSSLIQKILWFCSGANTTVLRNCPSEHSKFETLGFTILMTAVFAALSGGYALSTIIASKWLVLLGSISWGFLIFSLDRYLASSIRKDYSNNNLNDLIRSIPRLLLGLVIAFVISKPITIKLLEKEINAQVEVDRLYAIENIKIASGINEQYNSINSIKDEISILDSLENDKLSNNEIGQAYIELEKIINGKKEAYKEYFETKSGNYDNGKKRLLFATYMDFRDREDRLRSKIETLEKKLKEDYLSRKAYLHITSLDMQLTIDSIENENSKLANKLAGYQVTIFDSLLALANLSKNNISFWWIEFLILFLFFIIEISPIFVRIISKRGPYDEALSHFENKELEKNRVLFNKEYINSFLEKESPRKSYVQNEIPTKEKTDFKKLIRNTTISQDLKDSFLNKYFSILKGENKKTSLSDSINNLILGVFSNKNLTIDEKNNILQEILKIPKKKKYNSISKAKKAFDEDEFRAAKNIIVSSLVKNSNSLNEIITIAKQELDKSNFEFGEFLLRVLDESELSNEDTAFLLGSYYLRVKNLSAAEKIVDRFNKLSPKTIPVFFLKSKIALFQNDSEKSEKLLFEIIRLDKQHIRAYSDLSQIYVLRHRYDKAKEMLKQIVLLDSKNISALENLAKLNINDDEFDSAIKIYEQIINLSPNSVNAWKGLHTAFKEIKEEKKAEEALSVAKRLEEKELYQKNLSKETLINQIKIESVLFFEDISWNLQGGVNIILGKNGFGKTLLLRIILTLLQKDNDIAFELFSKGTEEGNAKINLLQDGEEKEIVRSKTIFEKDVGKLPILAITDVRSIDKSNTVVSYVSEDRLDLLEFGAYGFLNNKPDEFRIKHFLYQLCVKFLDNGKSFDSEIFQLLENVVKRLTNTKFKFHNVEVIDDVAFRLNVIADNSPTPIPFQRVSQGTLSTLAIFGIIYNYLKALNQNSTNVSISKGIVFIDEIDAHLHPDWQQKIVPLLRENYPNVQFIISAHSPLVVAGSLENEITVLRRKSEGKYVLHQFDHDFIGWEVSEIYETVFDIEDADETYIKYGMEYNFREKTISRIEVLEEKESLTEEEEAELEVLYQKEKYVNRYKAMHDKRENRQNQDELIQDLRERMLLLEEELKQVKEQDQ